MYNSKINLESGKKLKILIVEDDPNSMLLLQVYVKTFSKEVIQAINGEEAISLCKNHPDIDLVLMDVRMPVFDGYEATKQIRTFNKDVVIIAQTAFAIYGARANALAAGCNDYISKPLHKDSFLKLISNHFYVN
jgi:CheY-like chemotaxis protein